MVNPFRMNPFGLPGNKKCGTHRCRVAHLTARNPTYKFFTNRKISQVIKLLVKETTSQQDFCVAGLGYPPPPFSKKKW